MFVINVTVISLYGVEVFETTGNISLVQNLPGIPVITTIPYTDKDGNYTINWTFSEYANYYEVYENNLSIGTTTDTYFDIVEKSNGNYYYYVVAVNYDGTMTSRNTVTIEVKDNNTTGNVTSTFSIIENLPVNITVSEYGDYAYNADVFVTTNESIPVSYAHVWINGTYGNIYPENFEGYTDSTGKFYFSFDAITEGKYHFNVSVVSPEGYIEKFGWPGSWGIDGNITATNGSSSNSTNSYNDSSNGSTWQLNAPVFLTNPYTSTDGSVYIYWQYVEGAEWYTLFENGIDIYNGSNTFYNGYGKEFGMYNYTVQAFNVSATSPLSDVLTVIVSPENDNQNDSNQNGSKSFVNGIYNFDGVTITFETAEGNTLSFSVANNPINNDTMSINVLFWLNITGTDENASIKVNLSSMELPLNSEFIGLYIWNATSNMWDKVDSGFNATDKYVWANISSSGHYAVRLSVAPIYPVDIMYLSGDIVLSHSNNYTKTITIQAYSHGQPVSNMALTITSYDGIAVSPNTVITDAYGMATFMMNAPSTNETYTSRIIILPSASGVVMGEGSEKEVTVSGYSEPEVDSDNDGFSDSEESQAGSDPNNPLSTPNDKDGDGVTANLDQDDTNPNIGRKTTTVPGFEVRLAGVGVITLIALKRKREYC